MQTKNDHTTFFQTIRIKRIVDWTKQITSWIIIIIVIIIIIIIIIIIVVVVVVVVVVVFIYLFIYFAISYLVNILKLSVCLFSVSTVHFLLPR